MDDLNFERPTYASLSTPPRAAPAPPRRSVFPWVLCAMLLAFALGLIANPWFEREVRSRIPGLQAAVTPDINAAKIEALTARIAQLEQAKAVSADPQRLARVENRVETLDTSRDNTNAKLAQIDAKVDATAERADAALDTASEGVKRAQTLLLVATVRHALESGARLGALEQALRKTFPNQKPAVDAVAAVGSAPVTLAKLRADFLRLQPAAPRPAQGWWASVKQGLGDMVQVRRTDTPVPTGLAARPLAAQRLVAGDVAGAVTALGNSANPAWAAEARRYLAGQRGLAALEAATVARNAQPTN